MTADEQQQTTDENDARVSAAGQIEYWGRQSVDVDGMLGGYGHLSRVDIQFSRNFLAKLRRLYPPVSSARSRGDGGSGSNKESSSSSSASLSTGDSSTGTGTGTSPTKSPTKYVFRSCLETGAGIGRVTLNLLASQCETIDVVEPVEKFTARLTAPDAPLVKSGQLRRVYNLPLQNWTPESLPSWENSTPPPPTTNGEPPIIEHGSEGARPGRYDLVWNQWCLDFLSSHELVRYFRSLIPLLAAPDGWIIVKQNVSTAGDKGDQDTFWEDECSVTRSDRHLRALFEQAGLVLVQTLRQTGFPERLLPVRMYALRPAAWAGRAGGGRSEGVKG
ncbi:hypothetical protein AYL99_02609 [Fonsecaea erecta]|uniref:Alpha N-terminal protein methyltransferase 1 n=1 Tax=Fonsecaea erecta TaxID=1367422 RepID=A0A178ZUH0_9EURO|nr:hypothetical protein AYL99_02609 [Fonsecaea erecta]OAP63382.1 hypothetical protein AYL99_02609 [Fonsecaea erecta]